MTVTKSAIKRLLQNNVENLDSEDYKKTFMIQISALNNLDGVDMPLNK